MERVKDAEKFVADLERPLTGTAARNPTPEELEREGASFVAFARAFGVAPPTQLPSSESAAV